MSVTEVGRDRCGPLLAARLPVLMFRAVMVLGGIAIGDGLALPAADALVYPLDLAVARDGRVLIADRKLPGVLCLSDGQLTTLASGSQRFREPLNAVWSVAVDHEGRVLVGDSATRGVYRLQPEGPPQLINADYIGIPIRLAVDGEGRIYVSDLETQRIWRMPAEGGACEEFAVLAGVRGLAVDGQNRLWAARANPPQVVRFTPDGQRETIVDAGPFEFPHQIAVDAAGATAVVADGYAQCLWRVVPGQPPEKWVHGEPLRNPTGLAWQGTDLLVVDPRGPAVLRVTPAGVVTQVLPATP